ncbi:MAG TPA: amidohydrolase family protein [Candidatus Binataceae bacterium]|nr:amidohydrolase family protein [Candidatus Binataceae bacterium]
MATQPRFISAEDHVIEHPRVWTERLSKTRWGDRIPHLERDAEGAGCWLADGMKLGLLGNGSVGALMADRAAAPRSWDDVPNAAYQPAERLKALDVAGIDYSVLYPTIAGIAGETFGRIREAALELDCVRAYNDWLVEEWTGCSERFVAQCIVPLSSVEAAVEEIERAVAKGHKGVILPPVPRHLRDLPHINDNYYDPIWRTCEKLGVPICFHASGSPDLRLPAYEGFSPAIAAAFDTIASPASAVPLVSNFIVSRVLERFPGLKVVFAGSALGWIAFTLEATDYEFNQFSVARQIPYELKPSEAFQRQCYAVAWYDRANLRRACEYPGAENILWSAMMPMSGSSWPNCLGEAESRSRDLPDQARDKVLWRNAATLYKLS